MNKWGSLFGWIGLGAFLLAIPMSIAANLLTPKVRDCWASTSKARAVKRYESLRREIWRYRTGTEFDGLARVMLSMFGAFVAAFMWLESHVDFISLNQLYIAAINNMRLDEPVNIAHLHQQGTEMQYARFTFELFFYFFLYKTISLAGFISTSRRKRQIARLRRRRFQLKKKFNLVDN